MPPGAVAARPRPFATESRMGLGRSKRSGAYDARAAGLREGPSGATAGLPARAGFAATTRAGKPPVAPKSHQLHLDDGAGETSDPVGAGLAHPASARPAPRAVQALPLPDSPSNGAGGPRGRHSRHYGSATAPLHLVMRPSS